MTQLTLEDALEDHNDTVNIGGRTMTQLTLVDALEYHNDTVNIGGRTGRPQ